MIMMDYNNKIEDQETLLNLIKEEANLKEGEDENNRYEGFYKFLEVDQSINLSFEDLKKEYLREKSRLTITPEKGKFEN